MVEEIKQLTNEEAIDKLNHSYYEIIDILKSYIDTSEENYKIISLWIIGTYFHSNFDAYPYLFFNAMRGSGKTRTLRLISTLGAMGDGSVQNNLTEAVLFRIPKGTVTCIDEIEQINKKEKQTLRELLNSAYKKGMKVKRMHKTFTKEGEKQAVEVFEPYFPIVMANIYGIEEVLADRSICLVLEKSNKPNVVMKIEDFGANAKIETTLRELRGISVVSVDVVTKKMYIRNWNKYIEDRYNHTTLTTLTTYNTHTTHTTLTTQNNNNLMQLTDFGIPLKDKLIMEEFFNKIHDLGIIGRNFELFFPLLIIAKILGDNEFDDISQVISRLVATKKDEEISESKDVSLYEFVSELESTDEFISIKELCQRFRLYLGESDSEDVWLNDRWLGRAIKRLNLAIDKRRMASGVFVTLNYSKAKEKLKIFKYHEIK